MKMEHGCHVSARWGDAKLDMPEAYVGGCLHYGSTLLYLANLIPSREQSVLRCFEARNECQSIPRAPCLIVSTPSVFRIKRRIATNSHQDCVQAALRTTPRWTARAPKRVIARPGHGHRVASKGYTEHKASCC